MRASVVALLIVSALLIAGCTEEGSEKPNPRIVEIRVGSPAPTFTYPDMDGRPFSLEKERGKVVVLFFWRYRCEECKQMFASLKALQEAYPSAQLTIITIDEDTIHSGSIYSITKFFREKGYSFRVLRDDGAYLAGLYKTLWTPTVVVVDRAGNIAFLSAKEKLDFMSPSFRSLIDRLLSEKAPHN